jgi:hypothetical protein
MALSARIVRSKVTLLKKYSDEDSGPVRTARRTHLRTLSGYNAGKCRCDHCCWASLGMPMSPMWTGVVDADEPMYGVVGCL